MRCSSSAEPEIADEHVAVRSHPPYTRPFSLRRLPRTAPVAMVGVLPLIGIETVALQPGPLLTQIGIDEGIVRATSMSDPGGRLRLSSRAIYGIAVAGRVRMRGRDVSVSG